MSDLRLKQCPKCKRLFPVRNGSSLCSECSREKRESRARARDYKREYAERKESEDPRYRRFYRSKEWQMTSRHYAHSVGYRCEGCGGWGTDVHHVVPIQEPEGWERRLDETNLKMLCVSCHNEAHGRTFSSGWGDSNARRKAEEAAGGPGGQEARPPLERGEGGPEGGGSPLRVRDFR